MEEWVDYYKQYEVWILGVFFWLLSIPTGVFINRLDTYLKNRSLSAKERKIKTLLTRYINIKNLREHDKGDDVFKLDSPKVFGLIFISIILFALIYSWLPNFSWFRAFLVFIAFIPMYYSCVVMFQLLANVQDFMYFDSFKRRTIKKLKSLGCNPKEYGID